MIKGMPRNVIGTRPKKERKKCNWKRTSQSHLNHMVDWHMQRDPGRRDKQAHAFKHDCNLKPLSLRVHT